MALFRLLPGKKRPMPGIRVIGRPLHAPPSGRRMINPATTREWLLRQRFRELQQRRDPRKSMAGPITDMLRLAQKPVRVGEQKPVFKIKLPKPRRPAEEPEPRPLSKQQRWLEPVVVLGNEMIRRSELRRIEQMVISPGGLPEAIAMLAARHPFLTELMRDPKTFEAFINSDLVAPKWKPKLRAFLATNNSELRAVGLLLFLRRAYRNPQPIRNQIIQQRLSRLQPAA